MSEETCDMIVKTFSNHFIFHHFNKKQSRVFAKMMFHCDVKEGEDLFK